MPPMYMYTSCITSCDTHMERKVSCMYWSCRHWAHPKKASVTMSRAANNLSASASNSAYSWCGAPLSPSQRCR